MARYPGMHAPLLVTRRLEHVPLLAVGVILLVAGLNASQPVGVLLGCAIIGLFVAVTVLVGAAVRQEHRRQIDTGWLTTLPVTYRNDKIGTSVEHRGGERRATLGTGKDTFDRAAARVLRWEVKKRAGFQVIRVGTEGAFFSDEPVREGECAIVRYGPVRETVRVVRVLSTSRTAGFAYGTLPEHPVRGEEAFLVEWRDDDTVELVIRSFWRPNGWLWWLLSPVLGIARSVFLRRYQRALLD